MASGSWANASAALRASPIAMRAHCGVAAARPHAGVTPTRSHRADRPKPSRSVTATIAPATSSTDGRFSGAVAGTTPRTTVRPESTNSAMLSKSSALKVPASTDTPVILLRCNSFHGKSGAQLCSNTSAPAAATQVSISAPATVSSSGATGDSAVTPISRPPSAADSDGSSNCTTTGVSSRRASVARCAATPSASDAARSRSAPGSVIARWPLNSSRPAASVIGPGACTLTTRPPPRRPAVSQASSRASMSSSSRLMALRVTAPGRPTIR